ncbi:DUF3152 domain-containing protein [Streptomyces axinellae]|uniref:DUF3152 domain-containing protein n=1 Tax=Streptomyces axinellae TaxID=552788 RepID=UPI0031D7B590
MTGITAVTVAALLGSGLLPEHGDGGGNGDKVAASASGESGESGKSGDVAKDASPSSSPKPKDRPSHKPSPSNSPSSSSDAVDPDAKYPADGPGEFRTAAVSGTRIGSAGRLFRYKVTVEDNLAQTPEGVSKEVRRVLADPRGWTARNEASFQQVTSGSHDFTVVVATPGTVDRMCGRGGLDTGGEVNCRVGKNVIVNIKRWLLANPYYQHSLSDYHALTVNHEVGHFLGFPHLGCPGKGKPAPAMMQQIKGLHGCVANPWPYDRNGTYLSGPPARP